MSRYFLGLGVLVITLSGCSQLGGPSGALAFETYRDGDAEVYLVNVDGSDPINLTENPSYDGTPNWSPDGSQLTFTSERSGNPEVWTMTSDGGDPRKVTEGLGFNVIPDWAPDGLRILFTSNRTYEREVEGGFFEIPENPKIWVMQSNGGAARRITGGLGMDLYGDWSPDGKSIVFMTVRDGNPEIYIKPEDLGEWNLTEHPSLDLNPAWSPDGSQVAFMSDRDGNMEIYLVAPERGAVPVNITNNEANDGDPAWSPDGKWLAFVSDRDGNEEIYVMRVDGSGVRRVTDHPADDIHPQWRPQ